MDELMSFFIFGSLFCEIARNIKVVLQSLLCDFKNHFFFWWLYNVYIVKKPTNVTICEFKKIYVKLELKEMQKKKNANLYWTGYTTNEVLRVHEARVTDCTRSSFKWIFSTIFYIVYNNQC